MVHALEQSHAVLKPGGRLVDVHSLTFPPLIEIQFEDGLIEAGPLLDRSNFERYRQAFDAVDSVVARELFSLKLKKSAEFKIHIDSYESFMDWFDNQWDTSYLPLTTDAAIQKSMMGDGSANGLVVTRRAQVTGLKSVSE